MSGKDVMYSINYVNQFWIQEAADFHGERKRFPHVRYFAAAACLCLVLLGALRLGAAPTFPGPDGPGAVVPPVEASQAPAEADPTPIIEPMQPPGPQKVTINWNQVAVNEAEGMSPDGALLYYDPDLYDQETWGEAEIVTYCRGLPAPGYTPGGPAGGGQGVSAGIYREKATGEIVQDQAGRGFWVDYYEDGSPKSDDDIVIPRGFTVRCSRLGILHCAMLPVDEERVTDFDTVPVTLTHCSMKHGPFDPTQRAPDGLSNMPAGYYDIYVASFELDGVEYEVAAQRMELEELVRIVASIIKPYEDITVGVGCGMP